MTPQTVRKRHVFFISGFDPRGAAHFYRLYATGAASQSQTSGHQYQVGPRERAADPLVQSWRVGWHGGAADPMDAVQTTVEFLSWDDLVRANWPKGALQVAWGSVLAYAAMLSSGLALVRVWQQSRRTLILLAYPAVLWLLALLCGAGMAWALVHALGRAGAAGSWLPMTTAAVSWAAAALVLAGTSWVVLRLEGRLQTSRLLRIYRFSDLWARQKLPSLEDRLEKMSARVSDRLKLADADEVLVIGFSVGTLLAASVTARALAKCADDNAATERLSLLTLGHCIPLLGLLPEADRFREELAVLAGAPQPFWADYSAPSDWGSFALVNPFDICRITIDGRKPAAPVMLSPRFHTLFDSKDYALLKKDKLRLHSQYLMSAPKVGAYDYFLMTAGPWRLLQGLASKMHT